MAVLNIECAGLHALVNSFFCVPRETGRLLLPKKARAFGKMESKSVLAAI